MTTHCNREHTGDADQALFSEELVVALPSLNEKIRLSTNEEDTAAPVSALKSAECE